MCSYKLILITGVKNITATGNKFFLYYYSFINYTTTSWTRPEFKATVEVTDCKGFFQVISKYPFVPIWRKV